MCWDAKIPDSEDDCVTLLAEIRWPFGFQCECGSMLYCRLKSRRRVFECKACHRQKSVTGGTLLHGSRVPLRTWFIAIALMTRPEGLSAAELKSRTNIHYDTAWQILHRLRGGLQELQLKLKPPVTASKTVISFQPDPTWPFRPGHRTGLYVAVDECGTMVADFAKYKFRALHYLVTRHTPGLKEAPPITMSGPAWVLAQRVRKRLHFTHCSVSLRWLQAYLLEFCYAVSLPGTFALDLLVGVVHTAATSFDKFAKRRWYTALPKSFLAGWIP